MILLIRWKTERSDTIRNLVKDVFSMPHAKQLADELIAYKDTVPHTEGEVIIDAVYVLDEEQRIPSDFKFQ